MIVFNNKWTAIGLTIVLIGNLFFAGFSSLTVTSRIGYSMARDGGIPFSKFFSVVYKKT
jgi:amino acid transporter